MLLHHPLKNISLIGTTFILTITLILTQHGNGKPQESNVFENVAAKGLAMAGNMAEMIGNVGLISKQMGFQSPLGEANSNTVIGPGAAFRNDEDSSEEDDRRRKKRTITVYKDLKDHKHLHRGKRSPCHTSGGGGGGTGGTGGTGGGGTIPADGDDFDITERRRRAYARKMAARKKAQNAKRTRKTTTTGKRKYLVDNEADTPTVTRRKRQSEVDDLNQNMTDSSNDLQQQVQQFADKIRNVFENFMNSMNQMAQKVKQHFTGQQNTTMMNAQEI